MNVCDGTLVLGVISGDRSAFAELYDRRARLVRAVCYDQVRDHEWAADLTQEVFLRAYKNLRRLREPEKFSSWLLGIARQVCREWRRKRRHEDRVHAGLVQRTVQVGGWGDPPDVQLMELRDVIAGPQTPQEAESGLTEEERLALHAFYLQGRSVEEARGVLGISRSAFYRVLSSACSRLRRLLGGEELEGPTAAQRCAAPASSPPPGSRHESPEDSGVSP